jgi:hypothetical protein
LYAKKVASVRFEAIYPQRGRPAAGGGGNRIDRGNNAYISLVRFDWDCVGLVGMDALWCRSPAVDLIMRRRGNHEILHL